MAMRRLLYSSLFLALALAATACVYKPSLAQGNLIKQEELDQVEVGMTRNQVRFLLGTPMIDDPFHEEQWDYVYYLKPRGDKAVLKRWVSVIFDGDTVSEVIKDQELSPDL